MAESKPPAGGNDPRATAPRAGPLHTSLVLLVLAWGLWRAVAVLVELLRGSTELPAGLPLSRRDLIGLAAAALVVLLLACWDRLRLWRSGGWHSRPVATARLLLYCLVAAWLAYLLIVGSHHGLVFSVWIAATAAAFGGCLLLEPALRRDRPARLLRGLDFLLLNLCVLIIAAELGLRIVASLRPSVLFMRPAAEVVEKVERGRYPPGTIRYGFPVNRGGHYDAEFAPSRPGRRLVASIGDSFSAGVVHHHFHFTTVAERLLEDVAVYNVGLPSIDPPEYLHLLVTEVLPLDPDLVVVNLFIGNDLIFQYQPPDRTRGWRSLLDRDNVLVLLVPGRLLEVAAQPAPSGRPESPQGEILDSVEEVLRRHPWFADPMVEKPTFADETFLQIEGFRFGEIWRQPEQEFEIRLRPLLELRRAAGDIPVLVMLIPDEFQVNDELWQRFRPAQASEQDRNRGTSFARAWLEREGFTYLDLLPVLRAVPPMEDGRRHLYHLRDTHFNVRGNRVVGEALAEFVAPHLGVEDDGPV